MPKDIQGILYNAVGRVGGVKTSVRRGIRCITAVVLFAVIGTASAEQCWQIASCTGLVGVVRVNKDGDVPDAIHALFGRDALPRSGELILLRRSAILRLSFDRERDDRNLRRDDPIDAESESGQYLAAGSTVRVLGYQVEQHLFVVVQIVKYSSQPYVDEKKYKFNLADVI